MSALTTVELCATQGKLLTRKRRLVAIGVDIQFQWPPPFGNSFPFLRESGAHSKCWKRATVGGIEKLIRTVAGSGRTYGSPPTKFGSVSVFKPSLFSETLRRLLSYWNSRLCKRLDTLTGRDLLTTDKIKWACFWSFSGGYWSVAARS